MRKSRGDRVVCRLVAALAIGTPIIFAPTVALAQAAGASAKDSPQRAPDKFMIAAIDVSGATKLSSAEIEKLIYPFLGPDKSNDDVIAARKALQDAYSAKGFDAVLVDVPVQPTELFSQGIVQIAINETPLGRVRVVGAKYHSLADARAQIPSLVEGQPVDLKALQSDIAQANRFPDRTIDPSFRAGQVPGTIDIDLKVDDSSPFHASAELNNDNSPNTRPLRAIGTLRYSNLWGLGHTLSITGSLAPQNTDQSAVISASYNAPIVGTPWSFLFYGYKSNSNVAALGGTNVLGNGTQVGLRAVYRLPSKDNFQQISFGPDFKSFQEQIFLSGLPIRPTPIRYVPFVAEYTLGGSDDSSTFNLTLGATAGFRVVKHEVCVDQGPDFKPPEGTRTCNVPGSIGLPEDQFQGRSIDARENFIHFNIDTNYTHSFPGDVVMALRFTGQLADSPLVTNEQFSIGGMTNVRGYFVSEAVGDDGFVESLELRSPDLASLLGKYIEELRFYSFGDVGYARVRAAARDQTTSFRIGSLGAGARFRFLKYISGEFLIGVPLTDGPVSERGDPRYSFSIKGDF